MSMRFSFDQSQRQEQRQVLSQRLIQSMELLQLPLLRLEERIDQELQTNPVLERTENVEREEDDDASPDLSPSDEETDQRGNSEPDKPFVEKENEIDIRDAGDNQDDFQTAGDFAELYSDTIDENPTRSQNWLEEASARHHDLISNAASPGETLEENLKGQLSWFNLSPEQRALCETVIGNLDRFGYLRVPIEDLWSQDAKEDEKARWLDALKTVQTLEPRGVGARSLSEALLLQLPAELPDYEAVRRLIENHLDDFLHNRIPQISKMTGYSLSRIEAALAEIRRLNPRPGSEFDRTTVPIVSPDVYVERGENGLWRVEINDGNAAGLCVSPHYLKMLKDKGMDKGAKDYLRRNVGQARWLIDAIAQRKVTLLRVAQAIVRHQNDFFEVGPEKLRPLKMRQIADELGIHVTTVSRTCDDKWLQSPRGIYSFKEFFSGAAATTEEDGRELATAQVKAQIKEMIGAENKQSPLSDEEIAAKLKELGIDISRRTVAKYRDVMNIPSSRQRRDWTGKRA